MKRTFQWKFALLLLALCLAAVAFAGCNKCTVSFDTAGGNEIAAQKVEKGEKVKKPQDPMREGYTFIGWTCQGEEWSFVGHSVTENMTLTANWQANTYEITYECDGKITTETVVYDELHTLTEQEKNNYTFLGWYSGDTKIESGVWKIAENITLTAKWEYSGFKHEGATLTGLNSGGYPADLQIPSEIDGVTITSIGYRAFYNCKSLTSIEIPASVTSIGYEAFYGCTSLTSVTFAASSQLASIGSSAFYGCTSLKDVYINDLAAWCSISFGSYSANPLYYANNLYINGELATDITIPDGVTSIGNAFRGCTSLTSITIPASVTYIGWNTFQGCTSLTSIEIPASVTYIASDAFQGCTNLQYTVYDNAKYLGNKNNPYFALIWAPNTSITSCTIHPDTIIIADEAFSRRHWLESIEIPASVTYIGWNTFQSCTSLTSVTFAADSQLTSIENSFSDCTSLASIEIPANVTNIGDYAFYGCTSLASIEIPDSVTSIGYEAFYGCTSLASIEIPAGVTSIGSSAFSGCTSLASIEIPAGVTSIEGSAFSGCTNLQYNVYDNAKYLGNKDNPYFALIQATDKSITSCTIHPDTVIIADGAFYYCASLTSVEIPANVTSIGNRAFYGCASLASITVASGNPNYHSAGNCLIETASKTLIAGCKNSVIPTDSSVTSIGNRAFSYCTSLESIEIPASVTSIGQYAFYECASLTNINFVGTKAQWNSIDKEFNWNSGTGNYTVHCTDGDIAKY